MASPRSVSLTVRAQLVAMRIPLHRVTTGYNADGKFQTFVFAHDSASVAEALRTLHPEHEVIEDEGFASLVSNGQV